MIEVVALICALGQTPDECQPPTALKQVHLGVVATKAACGVIGQQLAAQAAGETPGGYWPKITCLPIEDSNL